jgi:hypothetical protein
MDPGTALAVTSLIWDIGKDIYTYVRTWKDSEEELGVARERLLRI